MLQELFRIPGLNLPIYSYGLMMVIGFLSAIQLAKYLARRSGLDPELFVNAGLIALVTGIAGARLSHVLENLSQFTNPNRSVLDNFLDAINLRAGGLTYYGGFLLAFPSLVFYAIIKKIPLRLGMDIVAPCIVIGLGFGRIGCFLNGCCYGAECKIPWLAVQFPYHSLAYEEEFDANKIHVPRELLYELPQDRERLKTAQEIQRQPDLLALAAQQRSLPVYPAQLFSAFTAFFIGVIALAFFTIPHAVGRGFALTLMLEGSTRYILELLRVEPPVVGNFSLSMIIGLGVAALGVILWFVFAPRQSPSATKIPSLQPAQAGRAV